MIIKAIIIEDEIAGQELLKKNISDLFPDCKLLGVADHVDKGIALITNTKPDLVFVDIHIKGGTGFDILSHFRTRNFEVIFITAYNRYAIQAIKEEALDYILKPINSAELKKGVSKAIERIRKNAAASHAGLLNITTYKGVEFVKYKDIVFMEADGSYTNIYLAGSKVLSTKSIGEYEHLLEGYSFFRTHHSFIVNTSQVEKFNLGRSGTLIMKTGHSIPVSQRKMKEFTEKFNIG